MDEQTTGPSTNVETVKRATDAYNRGDVESFAELITPDCEFFPWISGTVDSDSYRGREGLAGMVCGPRQYLGGDPYGRRGDPQPR